MAQPISDTNIPRLGSNGPVQKMDPINSVQVAVKADNLGVFYFACNVPMQALFVEDGSMDKSVSHELWFWPEVTKSHSWPFYCRQLDNLDSSLMAFRAVFLATWREIPESIERQYLIENVLGHSDDAVADKMRAQGSLSIHSFREKTLISVQ